VTDPSNSIPASVLLLTVAAGLAAANLYYAQPLLPDIAANLGIPIDRIGFLPAVTKIGFAIGIITILPLADMLERRRLIVTMLILIAVALAMHAAAPTASVAFAAAFLVGLLGVTPQLITPFSALLAPKGREGAAVGTVLSGILGGVLVSKVLAGFVGASAGWRALYWGACGAMIVLAVVLHRYLPESRTPNRPAYGQLMRSSLRLIAEESALRRHTLYGALTFATFMTFWSTYAIDLKDAFGLGPAAAGLFSIAGLGGIVGASVAGRQIDQGRFATICITAAVLMVIGFVVMMIGERSIPSIVAGVLLMDFGAGLSHAANQSSAFSLRPSARGRINSVYMTGYYFGGAIGTSLATFVYSLGGWRWTCAFGAACAASILVIEVAREVFVRRRSPNNALAGTPGSVPLRGASEGKAGDNLAATGDRMPATYRKF
jgi:predicted MFS family arabinose efflux permease